MKKFYELSRPAEHINAWGNTVYRIQAVESSVNNFPQYLHDDGRLKEGTLNMVGIISSADYADLDKAYLAINDYYVANGQHTPAIRVGGSWVACGVLNTGQTTAEIYGQTSESVVDSSNESEPMDFE